MDDITHTALIPLPADGGEVALPAELIERAKDYMAEALAESTREAYGRWQRAFTGWCERHGRQVLPASPETIAAWLTSLADGEDGRRPLARASINQALAAVTLAHRLAGHAFDRKHRTISMVWSGISRVKAMTEVERQASPFLAADVRDLLAMLNTALNIGCRDAALLTLGWGGAFRRSELVGLDWEQLRDGTGFVRIDERGILITLARSKTSQDKAETVVIPTTSMATSVRTTGYTARRPDGIVSSPATRSWTCTLWPRSPSAGARASPLIRSCRPSATATRRNGQTWRAAPQRRGPQATPARLSSASSRPAAGRPGPDSTPPQR